MKSVQCVLCGERDVVFFLCRTESSGVVYGARWVSRFRPDWRQCYRTSPWPCCAPSRLTSTSLLRSTSPSCMLRRAAARKGLGPGPGHRSRRDLRESAGNRRRKDTPGLHHPTQKTAQLSAVHPLRLVSYDRTCYTADLEFSRLESWSRDVLRPVFTSLGLGLGLGTSESWSWISKSCSCFWCWRSKSWIQVCYTVYWYDVRSNAWGIPGFLKQGVPLLPPWLCHWTY